MLAEAAERIDILYGNPIHVVSNCLRAMVYAPRGKRLIVADYNAIEARILPWLAGEQWVLDVFSAGEDVYKHEYAGVYHVPVIQVSKDQRQWGKVMTLSLGFQGAEGALAKGAKQNKMELPPEDEVAYAIRAWRERRPKTVQYWKALDAASISAVLNPGMQYRAGASGREVIFLKKGNYLYCRLPSGRAISYPFPRVKEEVVKHKGQVWTKETLSYGGIDSQSGKWIRKKSYGGLLAENVTQATARDKFVYRMLALEEAGYDVVLHTHDEIGCEAVEGFGSLEEMCEIMKRSEGWDKDLPLEVSGWEGRHYRK